MQRRMVAETIRARGIRDPRVLAAMESVPRHLFVPLEHRAEAYEDRALPLGHGQTVSQPYVVALMTELARVGPGDRVLEVGTGSGYQTAVLAACGAEVYSVERIASLAEGAREILEDLGYRGVHVRVGDGSEGWPEHAPFQAILVTAAPDRVPEALLEQLEVGGRLVVPEGRGVQVLKVYRRTEQGLEVTDHGRVQFVPLRPEGSGPAG